MESLTDEDPRSIGGYELRARLGQGGFGKVYLGLSPGGRAVAVKVLRPELGEDGEFLHRFRLEAAAAQRVNGLYTAPVVAAGLNERRPWVATAYVSGPSLARAVAANGPFPELAVWRLLAGLVEALQAIHACDLIHRDLKPENVLLAADGPRVIDFGISKSLDGTAMTATGMIIGTPSFMAPEQADGGMVGPESDVFSLGCVLAYAASGILPFGSGSHVPVLYRIVHKDPELDGVPPQLRAVIEGCLAKAPEARTALAELAKIGRNGPVGGSAQSALAFWPPPIGRLIREYEGQLDDGQDASGLVPSRSSQAVHDPLSYQPHDSTYVPHDSTDVLAGAVPPQSAVHSAAHPPGPLSSDSAQPDLTALHSLAPATVLPDKVGGYHQPGGAGALARRRGRRWLPWMIAGLGALAALAVAIMLYLNGDTSVPRLTGDSQAKAVERIDAAGLKPSVIRQVDSQVGSGLVIRTSPASGSSARKGQRVTVYLSAGPGVPVVHGLTWAQAQARIKAAGFVPIEHAEVSSTVKAGEVMGTQPATGGIVPASGQVTVDVSAGPASINLPDVKGVQATNAETELLFLGFSNVKVVTDPKSVAPKGEVDQMSPAPGRYPPSQQVILHESAGGVAVPNVIDDTQAEATAVLQQAGFTVQASYVAAPPDQAAESGTVYTQTPAAGVAEPKGTLVRIYVEPATTSTPTPSNTSNGNNGGNGGNPIQGFF